MLAGNWTQQETRVNSFFTKSSITSSNIIHATGSMNVSSFNSWVHNTEKSYETKKVKNHTSPSDMCRGVALMQSSNI